MIRFSFGELFLDGYLRWTGKRHLLPLLRSLKHAGRPSEVAFPDELVEQGLSLVLAGLNNTLAVQSNSSWVWPYWAERQIDPDSASFLPTGTGVIKHNLTARNWLALGCDGSAREAMVDPVGMITLRAYGWSWFPYLRTENATFLPPRLAGVRQELVEGTLPALRTIYPARPDVEWTSECLAVRNPEDGTEWLLCTHALSNRSDRPLTLDFGIALRPYNPLMFSPIGTIRHDDGLFRVNGKAALLLPQPPDRVTFSNRSRGDSLAQPGVGIGEPRVDALSSVESLSGVIAAAAEFRWTLSPGETRVLPTAGVIARGTGKPGVTVPTDADFAAMREEALRRLRIAESEGMTIRIPHAGLERAFRAVKGRLHVFDDGDRFAPGAFLYHGHWFRDAAFLALACDQVGLGERVASKTKGALARQDRDGFFRSQNGEWDSNGQAMWTLVGHVRRGGDPALLDRAWPALMRGARWIDRMRRKTRAASSPHFGLMPAGFSAEHFGPNDHYYWDAFWSLAGLEQLLWAARRLDKRRDAARLSAWIAELRADLEASTKAAFGRAGGAGLPCSPYRGMDSAAVGNLVALSPLAIARPDAEWVAGTVEFLARNNLRDGLFLQKIIHTGLNPYLSAQLARALLLRQDPRAFGVLEALLRHGGPAHAWPEAIHPRTGGGCMGDGDHGWAAAEFLNLLRDCLVREETRAGESDRLLLLSGAPEGWFRPGNVMEAKDAPTLHGTLSFRVEIGSLSLAIEWSRARAAHQDDAATTLCLPLHFARARGIPGAAWGPHLRVELPGESGKLAFDTPPFVNSGDSGHAGRVGHPDEERQDNHPKGRFAHA